jgi:hypothetical protein
MICGAPCGLLDHIHSVCGWAGDRYYCGQARRVGTAHHLIETGAVGRRGCAPRKPRCPGSLVDGAVAVIAGSPAFAVRVVAYRGAALLIMLVVEDALVLESKRTRWPICLPSSRVPMNQIDGGGPKHISGKARKITHSRPAQGATFTAKAAHAHERTAIMSCKVIRATAPELAVQMVGGALGGAHPTRPRRASREWFRYGACA